MAACRSDRAACNKSAFCVWYDVITRIADHYGHAEIRFKFCRKAHRSIDAISTRPIGVNQAASGRSQRQAPGRRCAIGRGTDQRRDLRQSRGAVVTPPRCLTNIDEVWNLFPFFLGNLLENSALLRAGNDQRCLWVFRKGRLETVDLASAQICCHFTHVRRTACLCQLLGIDIHAVAAIADKDLSIVQLHHDGLPMEQARCFGMFSTSLINAYSNGKMKIHTARKAALGG